MIKRAYTAGTEEKSDARITVRPGTGGIEITVEQLPHPRFRAPLTELITQCLQEEQISDVQVQVWDFGALDFVIRARLRTALREAQKEDA